MPVDSPPQAWNDACPPLAWLALVNRQALVARLLSATVHDVNNTLQVVSGAAEVLAMDPTPEAVVRRTDAIVAQSRQATTALQALTAFARDTTPASGRTRVKALAEHALALRMYALRKARIAVSMTGDETDCAARAGTVLQVLLNLLVNAEQALAGVPGATVTVTVGERDGRAVVRVTDNGPGMDPQQAARIGAWPPATAAAGGLGIGLLVSRALAEGEGGTLMHTDAPGGGATFELALPG